MSGAVQAEHAGEGSCSASHDSATETPDPHYRKRITTERHDASAINSRMVIILDDLGHSLKRGQQALALYGNVTYAVIPHTPYGTQLAEEAHALGKEVMVHAPMSTVQGDALGEGGLTPALTRQEFHSNILDAIAQIPFARGINNHMGSDLTTRRTQMAWLMQELRWQDLYFVDSRTSENTVAAKVATEFNVPNLSRHIFLDNERTRDAIDKRFREAVTRAHRHGLTVVIGHPYPETLAYLKEVLPYLAEGGVDVVSASRAIALKYAEKKQDNGGERARLAHTAHYSTQMAHQPSKENHVQRAPDC